MGLAAPSGLTAGAGRREARQATPRPFRSGPSSPAGPLLLPGENRSRFARIRPIPSLSRVMNAAENITIGQVVGILRRRWPVVVQLTAVGAAAAFLLSLQMPKQYEASASVLVGGSDSLPLVGSVSTPQSLSPATAAGLIPMRAIAERAKASLQSNRSTGDL